VPLLTWLLLAAVGVADPAQRFAPVPEPARLADSCGERGAVGRWVKMSAAGAPASIHNQGWLDSTAVWDGARIVVALRRGGKWTGSAFEPCRNAWAPIAETTEVAHEQPWSTNGQDRPFVPSHARSSYDGFEKLTVWDAARKAWVAIAGDLSLAPRAHYAVALEGRRFLVWGGWAQTLGESGPASMGAVGDGAVLDLDRKTWRTMTRAGAPSARIDPTAVAWTGSRLIVWGGRASFGLGPGQFRTLGDGAQYDPAADRWTAMSSVNAPSPRTEATVAWTGRKLVVMGGAPDVSGQPLHDGGVYDPAADRWTPLPPPPGGVTLPRANVGPLTRIFVLPDGRVLFLPEHLGKIVLLDADRASWSTIEAAELGRRNSFRAFLLGRRLIVWGGVQLIAEHLCGPPIPGQPICDPWAETAARDDGWMILLP
jgi:hypothetical protein